MIKTLGRKNNNKWRDKYKTIRIRRNMGRNWSIWKWEINKRRKRLIKKKDKNKYN